MTSISQVEPAREL